MTYTEVVDQYLAAEVWEHHVEYHPVVHFHFI